MKSRSPMFHKDNQAGAGSRRADEPSSLTRDEMRAAVGDILGESAESISDADDLIHRGLDSIAMMRLANAWRKRGVELKFAEMIASPTLAAWWHFIDQATRERPDDSDDASSDAVDETQPFELAPMQQAYWIGATESQLVGPMSAQYYVEFDGQDVDPARLERAVRALQQRHPLLRARFLPEGRQQVMQEGAWRNLQVHDMQALPAAVATEKLSAIRTRLATRRMAIEAGEVFDIQLSLLPLRVSRVHVAITMLIADARSFQIFLDDLAQIYEQPDRQLRPLGYTFQKYLATLSKRRKRARERAKGYWQARLEHMAERPLLPVTSGQERLGRHTVGRRFHRVPSAQQALLERHCREHGITLSSLMLTAFVEVIGAWSVEPRFLINMPLFDRQELDPDVGFIVGDFSNLLILSADVTAAATIVERARQLQAQVSADASHAEFSGLEVLRELARSRPGDWALAPVVFTSAIGMGDLFSPAARQSFGQPGWTISQTPQVWLDFQVTERDGGLLLNWDVVEEMFADGVIDAMFDAYVRLLAWLADTGPQWSQLPCLLPPAQTSVRAQVNSCRGPLAPKLLHDDFFARAREQPDRIALARGENETWTYGMLAGRAHSIASMLRAEGIKPGDAVAITMARSCDYVAAVLGALAAGAIFVPVSIDQPCRRRAQIYASAAVRAVVTRAEDRRTLEWPDLVPALLVERAYETHADSSELTTVDPQSLSYVIYTSGSTGTPKGVEISHVAAMNTIGDINERFGVTADDRVLAVSAGDFDLSIYDIFGLLGLGGAVVVLDEQTRIDAHQWVGLAQRWQVTLWNSVPALLEMFLIATGSGSAGLRLAMVSGDWIPLGLPERLRAVCPACRFIAMGGATEASIWSNWIEVDEVDPSWRSIPYGLPLRNQKFRVVDHCHRDRPDWVAGDLWIGGSGVGRGYRGDPERTALQFVEHEGERWYKTGDRARYWPCGTLEFLGRRDLQVKIKGHRIELGEIEETLITHGSVSHAAVVVAEGGRLGAFVCTDGAAVTESELREHCVARLPLYMVPTSITIASSLPLSANGKVDRRQLERLLSVDTPAEESEQPASELESRVARLWGEILGIEQVGRRQNFFALGGDSLLATRLIALLRRELGVEIPLLQMQLAPTVSELAQLIDSARESVEEGTI